MHKRALLILLLLQALALFSIAAAAGDMPADPPTPPPMTETPAPPAGDPDPGGGAPGGVLTQIFQVVFSDKTLAEALLGVFEEAAADESERLESQTAAWGQVLGEVLQAPGDGYFQAVAGSSLYTAAAIAAPLFLLRLALYHWSRLIGGDDSALQAVGDWVAAGALAVAAGPFLDLLTTLSYWMAGAALGETAQLALAFVQSISVFDVLSGVSQVSLFSPLVVIGSALGGILAMTGMLLAFGAAQAVLFLLAVVAPPIAVASVLPQMRWLRALWLKAASLLALVPIVAGGIFKASISLAFLFSGGGILSIFIRLLWLWGATGALLSLAGILGRLTLSASVGTLGKLAGGVKAVVGAAALVFAAGGAAGAGGAVAGTGGFSGGGGGLSPTGLPAAGLAGSGGSAGGPAGVDSSADQLGHYDAASEYTRQAGLWGAWGFQGPAAFARSQARLHELEARKLELADRMERFAGRDGSQIVAEPGPNRGFGFSESVNARIGAVYPGGADAFQESFDQLSGRLRDAGLDPQMVAETYPEDTARMAAALAEMGDQGTSSLSLRDLAERGGAEDFLQDVLGEGDFTANRPAGEEE